MKILTLPLILLLAAASASAQKQDKPAEYPWRMVQSIYTSDSTGVARVTYSGERSGLAFINQEGALEKELPLPGNAIGIGKWHGNIIAFYIDEFDYKRVTQQIHAALIDAREKTILEDKIVYNNPGDKMLQWSMGNDCQDQFDYLLIRVTGQEGAPGRSWSERERKHMEETSALWTLGLSDHLQAVLKPLASAAIGGFFLNNYANCRGEITIVSYTNDQLVAERFAPDGALLKKVSTPLDYAYGYNDWDDSRRGSLDPVSGDTLTFSLAHPDHRGKDQYLSLVVFDLKGGKTLFRQCSQLNKDYFRQFRIDEDQVKSKHFRSVEYLRPDGIFYVGDKLVVFNEIRYNWAIAQQGDGARFDSEGVIVNFYDRKYQLVRQLFLDRYYESFFNAGRGLSYCLRDGKILAFGNEIPRSLTYGNFYYVIDPETYTSERKDAAWGDIPKSSPVNLGTMFWFRSTIVKNHYDDRYLLGSRLNSYMEKISY
jgi:hypothetical protein